MNKEFKEHLENEIYEIKEMNEDIRSGYEAGVYDSNTYLLQKYDELHKPVVVPDFVADWIKESKEKGYPLAYAINCSKGELGKWLHGCGTDTETEENQELFAEAWLEGYTVEEEQKYYVDLDTAAYVAKWNGNDQVDIYTDGISGSDEFEFHLTEEEIKSYDERFWPFAIKVEELTD